VANEFGVECREFAPLPFDGFHIVINATPVGTHGEYARRTLVTAEHLRGVRLAYDLVYNPIETRFLREARDAGCDTLSGLEMLVAQAVEQFKLWTGQEPDAAFMEGAARAAIQQQFG